MFNIIEIKEYEVLSQVRKDKELELELQHLVKPKLCPYCGGDHLHSKGRYVRWVKHLDVMDLSTRLKIHLHRYQCKACGKSFLPQLPAVKPYRQSSEPLRKQVYQLHQDGVCSTTIAQRRKLSAPTVNRIYQQFTQLRAKERISWDCPTVLGIDEHTLHKGCRFATTLCNLKTHKVFDVVEGRSGQELESYFSKLKGRKQVRVVCIDLSSTYLKLVKKWFPRAKIVADRFHVVRLVMHHFMKIARAVAPQIKNQRGALACLRKRPDRLSSQQTERLNELLDQNPALKELYDKMQKLVKLMNEKQHNQHSVIPLAKQLLGWIEELSASGLEAMHTLAESLSKWRDAIGCMWRFSKNNGITEGFHRKMKLIQRRAYGFKNFNNYRLRVIAQCG